MVEDVRNIDRETLVLFEDIFAAHGCLGFRDESAYNRIKDLSEWTKLSVVPLVFSLIPEFALSNLRDLNTKTKPQIRRHIEDLGIQSPSERLITILKRVADNFFSAKIHDRSTGGSRRKKGLSDLKSRRQLYEAIRSRQCGRCALCGDKYENICQTLDHILPHSIGGDPQDGSNWQVLCDECNTGKGSYISSYQSPASLNWIYSTGILDQISSELRYVTLSQLRRCQEPSCNSSALNSKLIVQRRSNQGLLIASHVTVYCEVHAR
jgi:5-methylcytosine-specific restriction endonuclease McrA